MKAILPPNAPVPMWARKEFRRFLLFGFMGLAVIAVFFFQIMPTVMQGRVKRGQEAKVLPQNAWRPRTGGPEAQPSEIRFDGVLDKVQDSTPIQTSEVGYVRLLKYMGDSKAETLVKEAKLVDYSFFPKHSAELRGQTTQLMGLFLYSSPIRLDKPVGEVEWIHRTYLMKDIGASEGYVVDLLEAPGELAKKTLVSTDAAYLKLATYDGRKGPVQAPFFIGKGLKVVHERMAGDSINMGILAGAAGAMALMAVLYVGFHLRRKERPRWTSSDILDKTVSKA